MKHLDFGHTASPRQYQQAVAQVVENLVEERSVLLPLAEAHLRYAAEAVYAASDIPGFANSQMDGYALTPAAAARENRTFTVGKDIPAGSAIPLDVNDDIVYPIMTGAPLPQGYDCVIPEEKACPLGEKRGTFAAAGSQVELPLASRGQFVRYPGEDIRAGEKLLDAGMRLTAAHLGALAAQGIGQIRVKDTLNILVLTGGDEVAQGGESLASGQIYDANGPVLKAHLSEFSARVTRRHLSDQAEDLCTFLEEYTQKNPVDLILSSGGISHGKYEVVKNAVHLLSQKSGPLKVNEYWFGHVTQQPGGPQGITLLDLGKRVVPLLSFPGNPVSTLITSTLVLRPALSRFYSRKMPCEYLGKLVDSSAEISAPAGKTQFRRALVEPYETGFIIRADAATGSHLLHRAATANALVELEPGTSYRTGDTMRWYPLNDF